MRAVEILLITAVLLIAGLIAAFGGLLVGAALTGRTVLSASVIGSFALVGGGFLCVASFRFLLILVRGAGPERK